jgi:signal transduction histidine kinase/ligand-binding sensor domain-containing protein
MGTYNGLVRFDGVHFQVFDSSTAPKLRDGRVTSLLETRDGKLWIGHETGGLTTYWNGSFERVDLGSGWPGGAVVGMAEDETGEVWLVDSLGIVMGVTDRTPFLPAGTPPGTPVGLPSMCRDAAGKVWTTYRGAVTVVTRGGLTPVELDEPPAPYILYLCPGRDGGLWVMTATTVRKWRNGEWLSDLGACPWSSSYITSAVETRDGRLMVGTLDQGLYIVGPAGQVEHLSRENGLPHEWVRSLCEDHEGNLWVGTSGAGLCVLRKAKVVMAGPPDGWLGRSVLSVAPGRDGQLWAGTEGAGLYQLSDGKWTRYGAKEGLSNPFVWSVLEDREGTLRVGTWGQGLFAKLESVFTVSPGWAGLQIPVTAIHQAADGVVWVGTRRGLLRLDGTNVVWVHGNEGASFPDVRTVTDDSAGTIWFGTTGRGLGRLKDGNVTLFTTQEGLASNFILSLYPDQDGTLWIGTLDNGLCRFRQGLFRTINKASGLANNVIGAIADDGLGYLWLSSQKGILRVSKDELHRHADGESASVACLEYGKHHGLATLACSAGFSPSWCRTADGRLVFPTARGIAVVDPREVEPNEHPPSVRIEEVVVEANRVTSAGRRQEAARGDSAALQDETPDTKWLEMAPDERRLEIHYTALSFAAPEKVLFRYRLEPLEKEWVEAGTRRSANYSFVPPGNYTFQVTACNNDGVWNATGAQLGVSVLPRFWQISWFRILMGCLVIAAVAGVVFLDARRQLRRKMERLEGERAVDRERSRIAQDIHDDLGASLTRILMLTQEGSGGAQGAESVEDNIRQVHATARALTREMDEIVWAVNPEHDTLESLVNYLCRYAQTFLSAAQLRCRLDVPLDIPARLVHADVRHNLFLAFKEVLNNIVKHACATKVWVTIDLLPTELRLELRDDGLGLQGSPAAEASSNTEDSDRIASGLGLDGIRRRLTQMGGRFEVRNVEDQGATCELWVPFEGMSISRTSSRRSA